MRTDEKTQAKTQAKAHSPCRTDAPKRSFPFVSASALIVLAIFFSNFVPTIVHAIVPAMATTTPVAAPETLVLSPGRFVDHPAPGGGRISVSNGAVIKVKDLGRTIRVIGKKNGSSSIDFGRGSRTAVEVHVIPQDSHQLYLRLKNVTDSMRGLNVEVKDSSVHVLGRLLRWEDWLRLAEAARGSKARYTFSAVMDSEIRQKALSHFSSLIRRSTLPDATLKLDPWAIALAPKEPADLKERLEQVLGEYGFRVDHGSTALGLEPLVRVRIIVAEFRKSMMQRTGIGWPGSVTAKILPEFAFPGDAVFSVDLKALESRGVAKVLASPTLVCRSGKEAQFLAGGEFPIKIANFKNQDVIWKKYGVLLKIQPKADFSGRMSLAIQTEVSSIDSSRSVDGVPGLLSNRIETHFDLASSRTIALSGLIKKDTGHSGSGLPYLKSLPVLGPLFSSRDFHEDRTELVIFVTPEVVTNGEDAL
jgi:pilus assembly protein CpaC